MAGVGLCRYRRHGDLELSRTRNGDIRGELKMLGLCSLAQIPLAAFSLSFVQAQPVVPALPFDGINRARQFAGDNVLYIGGVLDTPWCNPSA